MKTTFILLTLIFTLFSDANATELKTLPQGYQIIFDKDGTPIAKSVSDEITGHLIKRLKIYSAWKFSEGNSEQNSTDLFGIIINDKTRLVMSISDGDDGPESGPDLDSVSPGYNNYVVLTESHGLGPDSFEIKTPEGKLIFEEGTRSGLIWINDHYVIYDHGIDKKSTKAQSDECKNTTGGDSYYNGWFGYDIQTKRKISLNIPPIALCTQ